MPAQVIECASACTVTVQHEITLPLLSLTTEEAAPIAVAIAAIWVIGWAFRVLIQMLSSSDGFTSKDES